MTLSLALMSSLMSPMTPASAQTSSNEARSPVVGDAKTADSRYSTIVVNGGLSTFEGDAGVDAVFAPSLYADSLFLLGAGIGWRKIQEYSWISPLLSFRIMLRPKGISPLVFAELGYSFGSFKSASTSDMNGVMLGIGGGLMVPLGHRIDLLPELGFRFQRGRGIYGGHNFNGLIFKTGVSVKHNFHYSSDYGKMKALPARGENSRLTLRGGVAFWEDEFGPSLEFVPTLRLHPRLTAGLGLGLEDFEYNTFVSLFLKLRGRLLEEWTTPVLFGEFGYSLEWVDGVSTKDTRGFMFALGGGVEFPVGYRYKFSIDLSYKMQSSRRYMLVLPSGRAHTRNVSLDFFRLTGGFSF